MAVLGGMKYRPAASRHDMTSKSFSLAGVSLSLQNISSQNAYPRSRYKLLHGSFVRKQHSPPLSESQMAMTSFSSLLVSDVAFMPTCGTSVQLFLLRRHEILLELIALAFMRKIARDFLS